MKPGGRRRAGREVRQSIPLHYRVERARAESTITPPLGPKKPQCDSNNLAGLGRDGGSRSPKRGVGTTRFWVGGSDRDPALDWRNLKLVHTRVGIYSPYRRTRDYDR
jgi:hypothetical protein